MVLSMSAWQHFKAIILLPFMVTIVIPIILLLLSHRTNFPWMFLYPINLVTGIAGFTIASLGYTILYKTIRLFATIGKGTLAPWNPTQHLVTTGLYQYTRNPMILGVLLSLGGIAIIFGSSLIAVWCLLFWILNHLWFVYYEEPDLERRFGNLYRQYKQNVPRWVPRHHCWNSDIQSESSATSD